MKTMFPSKGRAEMEEERVRAAVAATVRKGRSIVCGKEIGG